MSKPRRAMASAIFALSAGTLISACQPIDAQPPSPAELAAAECNAQGGEIRRVGMMGSEACVIPFADAGQSCSDASDCEGRCLLSAGAVDPLPEPGTRVGGQCQPTNQPFGCYAEINDGRVDGGFICVD